MHALMCVCTSMYKYVYVYVIYIDIEIFMYADESVPRISVLNGIPSTHAHAHAHAHAHIGHTESVILSRTILK